MGNGSRGPYPVINDVYAADPAGVGGTPISQARR